MYIRSQLVVILKKAIDYLQKLLNIFKLSKINNKIEGYNYKNKKYYRQ